MVLLAITTICVALRFISKLWVIRCGFQLDDYFLTICYVRNNPFQHASLATQLISFSWPILSLHTSSVQVGLPGYSSVIVNALTYAVVRAGYGKHVFQLEDGQLQVMLYRSEFAMSSSSQHTNILKVWWSVIVYTVNLGLVKICILIFYLRLFPYDRFRQCTWALIIFVSCTTVVALLLGIFQCTPIAYYWDKDISGTCLSYHSTVYTAAALVIVSDFIIVLLPVPVIKKLNLTRRRKIGVLIMFGLGSL